MKVLIIRFSSIGDIVFTTAIPKTIKNKYTDWELHFLTKYDYKDLIEYNHFIDKKIYYKKNDGLFNLIKLLKKENYDLVYDAHNSLRTNIILLFLNKSKIIQYNKQRLKRFLLTFFKINLYKKFEYQYVRFLKPLKKIKIFDYSEKPSLNVPSSCLEAVKVKLEKYFTDKNKKIIALVPGAAWKGKIWPKYEELVDKLSFDYNVVLLGGKKESYLDLWAYDKENIISFAANLSILHSIAVIYFSDLIVSNDTGLLHAAEAVGKDVICIMGPTSKELACPYRDKSIVIDKEMWCRPCSKNGSGICFKTGSRPCLNKILVDEVYSKIKDYFNK